MEECTTSEMLIEAVKENPILYDRTHKHYRNKFVNDRKWIEIGELLNIDGEAAKKRWRGLRDSYTKHLRAIRSNGRESLVLSRYKSWPWAEHMSFLTTSQDTAQADSNLSQVDTSNDTEDTGKQVASPSAVMDSSAFSPIIETTFSLNKQNTGLEKRRKILGNFSTRNPVKLPEIDDEIDLMFESFAKTVKRFSPKRKIILKAKLAKLIFEEELANFNDLPVKCDSCSVSVSDHWTTNNPGMDYSEHDSDTDIMNSQKEKAVHFLLK
ncbi:hypothetical protein LSTR_LSTR002718 [Laodelphax striatellus]|uniref:MADF domain-containing protein n=1 Tax=Laodelphax striatellus TaxID=195883 RepID=A0A482X638_LAOST|nr:hypothetical protein LSTR_LSTR002718 [Laodelphax striatellus]